MKLPSIPAWLLPWRARQHIAQLESAFIQHGDMVRAHGSLLRDHQELQAKHAEAVKKADNTASLAEQVEKQKKGIAAMVAWIAATHNLDKRADEHGLTDILKEFPRR